MPLPSQIEKTIPSLYRSSALNLLLFGFVRGVRATLHTISVSQAVDMFVEEMGVDVGDFNRESAITTYNRMQNKLIESLKNKSK